MKINTNIDELNSELRAGSEYAFKTLFGLTYPRLICYANMFMQDKELSKDIVQDTFVKFWEKRKNLKDYPPAERLLFVMLKNNCLRYLRDNKFFRTQVSIDQHEIDAFEEVQSLFEFDFLDVESGIIAITDAGLLVTKTVTFMASLLIQPVTVYSIFTLS